MSEVERIAVVTGANKGIGHQIVKDLCKIFKGKVYLTARDPEKGKAAVEQLKKDGYNPEFYKLDITVAADRETFAKHLKDKHGGLDVLVNNAGIAYKTNSTAPFIEQAKDTIGTNYFSTLNVCEVLFPLLRPHARVVNVSSSCGHLSLIPSDQLRKKFSSPTLTVNDLNELVNKFITDVSNNVYKREGWPESTYIVSKVALSALTFIQQKELSKDKREDIVINSVHPGYVNTDMTSHKGPMTVEEGAYAPVKLATLPENVKHPVGRYIWYNMEDVDWVNGPVPAISSRG